MLKIIAFLVILYFFLRSIGSVVTVLFGGGQPTRQQRTQNKNERTTKGGLNVDYNPKNSNPKDNFKGGDYVEYEEVE